MVEVERKKRVGEIEEEIKKIEKEIEEILNLWNFWFITTFSWSVSLHSES